MQLKGCYRQTALRLKRAKIQQKAYQLNGRDGFGISNDTLKQEDSGPTQPPKRLPTNDPTTHRYSFLERACRGQHIAASAGSAMGPSLSRRINPATGCSP
jgi:hypothetical protein